jgi:flagellar hook protein FlgE
MSINSAMQAGVSGLIANSSALAAISDNIANVNTVGYKRSQANFSSMVTSQNRLGTYSAGGVSATTRQFVNQQGLSQSTTSGLDLSITGPGFFVGTAKAENIQDADVRSFTRVGSFQLDNAGYLRNDSGLYLQGWIVNSTGEILTDPSDMTRLGSINVASVGGSAEATTKATINANLKSGQAISAAAVAAGATPVGAGAYSAATNSMAAYDPEAIPAVGVKPDFEVQIPVADTKGGKRTVALSLLKSDEPNQWYAEIRAVPAADVVTGAGLANGQIKTGMVVFTPDGRLDTDAMIALGAGALFSDPDNPTIRLGASSATAPAASTVQWAEGLGINAQDIRIELGGAAGGLTQFDSQSVVQAVTTNGTAFGNLSNVAIDKDGYVTAVFDNGVTRRIAQVALATFPNPDGLISQSGNAYRLSTASGGFSLKSPGTGGAGSISPSTLESSTVDLSTEFTGLITTQRAYSASSKIITTADQMLEELLTIKR